ncbi:DUF3597 domain-containing protein [Cupriavidus sp. AU9028]|uniref:DUF3597 domain-containing protein n=1 Tax=Cupriavidus sp. AU9028 TaxID=2871157 RepID=UPI001C960C60|nr:DUF3597 domain-containing protein [Cupriavidus sp. AU9028]MBY4895911.1 DUF3597 domain-containing protein [Cupriavidus sp. AU9028]
MSIFGEILNRLRGKARPTSQASQTQASGQPATQTQGAPAGAPAQGAGQGTTQAQPSPTAPVAAGATASAGGAAAAGANAAPQAPLSEVDVEKIMDDLVGESGQKLNWRTSIVDTMKALGIDSSLDHRKELARELQYTGDMNDSAAMNVWLHKRVMKELAANGGRLPPELRD